MAKINNSIFVTKVSTQSKKVKLESTLSNKAIKGALAYRGATGSATIDILGNSLPSKRLRNNIARYANENFPAKNKKAELVILMNINSSMANRLKSPKTTDTEVDAMINKMLNTTSMLNNTRRRKGSGPRIMLREFIVQNQTESEFASNSVTNSLDDYYYNDVYDEEVQQALSDAFVSVK